MKALLPLLELRLKKKKINFHFGIPKGDTGADGATPTLSVGTVTTGAAGSSAAVTMTGTAPNYVLNFTIPRGATGATGASGTYTGPLMPTTSYWTNAVVSGYGYYTPPSGGTWAWFTLACDSDSITDCTVSCGVSAGGTSLGGSFLTSASLAGRTLCWRIQ